MREQRKRWRSLKSPAKRDSCPRCLSGRCLGISTEQFWPREQLQAFPDTSRFSQKLKLVTKLDRTPQVHARILSARSKQLCGSSGASFETGRSSSNQTRTLFSTQTRIGGHVEKFTNRTAGLVGGRGERKQLFTCKPSLFTVDNGHLQAIVACSSKWRDFAFEKTL